MRTIVTPSITTPRTKILLGDFVEKAARAADPSDAMEDDDDNDEENDKLLLGSEWGLSNNPSERVTTMDERNLWMEKIRILESENVPS